MLRYLSLLLIEAATATAAAPRTDLPSTAVDEVITIIGSRTVSRSLQDEPSSLVPFATSVLEARDIRNGRPTLSLAESLAPVPGLLATAETNFAQDTRLSIRGFGARSPFGIRGIRVFLDGIPLTLPDGQTQIDTVDLAHVGRIEVLRGPAASLYGNAAGGVLVLESDPITGPLEADIFNLVGAFGTWKLALGARGRAGDAAVAVFASRTQVEGFRDRSRSEQLVAQARTLIRLAERANASVIVHYVNAPVAEDPGALRIEELREARERAAEPSLRFLTGESVSQLQVGTRVDLELGRHHGLEASAHVGLRDFVNAIPSRVVDFSRDFYGALFIYRWREPNWLSGHRLTLGAEVQGQQDRRTNRGNEAGEPTGEVLLLQVEEATSLGLFAQERLTVLEPFALIASARFDHVAFEVEDDLPSDGDASGRRAFSKLTGQGGAAAQLAGAKLVLFGNVAQSYETPTFTELVVSAPDESGLSQTLEAQDALSFEVGCRGQGRYFRYEAATFFIELENELIARENEENRTFFTNAGASRRIGAEALLHLGPWRGLDLTLSYSFLRSTFQDEDRAGLLVPGLPEHRFFGRVRYDTGYAHLAVDVGWVDDRFVDDANTLRAPSHTLVDLRGGLRFALGSEANGDLSVGIRNLFDVPWVDNVRVNPFGGRAFEPGPPLHVFGTLAIHFEPGWGRP